MRIRTPRRRFDNGLISGFMGVRDEMVLQARVSAPSGIGRPSSCERSISGTGSQDRAGRSVRTWESTQLRYLGRSPTDAAL